MTRILAFSDLHLARARARDIVEAAEEVEPLLSNELYETLRRVDQAVLTRHFAAISQTEGIEIDDAPAGEAQDPGLVYSAEEVQLRHYGETAVVAFRLVATPPGGAPVDYETLAQLGSIMGSGGMVVMDEDNCMVDVARYFVEFTHSESCGKCVPCRVGGRRMLEILTRITDGKGTMEDIDTIQGIAQGMETGALCALGQLTPGPIKSALRYFRDEFETHILDKRCDALVCKDLVGAPCQAACPVGEGWPLSMGRSGSRYHSFHEPKYRRTSFTPASFSAT